MSAAMVATDDYPVVVAVESRLDARDRLTTLLRPILSIPHMILVGPGSWFHRLDSAGLLGAAAYVLAVFNWFVILITGRSIKGTSEFQLYYLRWRTRALAYMALFVDVYPPFGEGNGLYPATVSIVEPVVRDRATVAFRPFMLLPHVLVLVVLVIGWALATLVAWLAILLSGSYPAVLQPFCVGVMRWLIRVEAYALLLVDQYPPFALE